MKWLKKIMKQFSVSTNSNVVINGNSYSGSNVSIVNGKVVIDGVTQSQQLEHIVNVVVEGSCESLQNTNGDVTVHDRVGSVETTNGDIECHDVKGNVTSHNGDIKCYNVGGSVSTHNGDIKRR